jgi:hypothetical protein
MNAVIKKQDLLIEQLASSRLFQSDFDCHFVRASMVFTFLIFGYQKWFDYWAETLIPFIRTPATGTGSRCWRRSARAGKMVVVV